MTTTFPPPTGPSLEDASARIQAPAGAVAFRSTARAQSWVELAPAHTPHVVRHATVTGRLWARIIDLFVYGAPVAVVGVAAALLVPKDDNGLPADTKLAAAIIAVPVVVAAITAFRFIRALAVEGSTVGRQADRIVVVRAGTDEPIGYGRAIVRIGTEVMLRLSLALTAVMAFGTADAPELALTCCIVALVLNVLDIAWMLWDPRHQTLHDKAAGSVVVRD